jgi:nucleoside 2-deoxyribosyltransferase
MIVYCATPVRGQRTYQEFFQGIIEHVKSLGHTALSELNSDFKPAAPLTDSEIFARDIKWIDKSKVLIAEISGSSTGVGFEIAYALYKKKIPALVLINNEAGNNVSAMIKGCNSPLLNIRKYDDVESLKKVISEFLKKNSD